MREFSCAWFGEVHAISAAQLAALALEVGALLQEAAGFIDKAVPDVDIGDARLGRRRRDTADPGTAMSDVPLTPRIAGKPTHSTGTPLDFSTPISSSIFLL